MVLEVADTPISLVELIQILFFRIVDKLHENKLFIVFGEPVLIEYGHFPPDRPSGTLDHSMAVTQSPMTNVFANNHLGKVIQKILQIYARLI